MRFFLFTVLFLLVGCSFFEPKVSPSESSDSRLADLQTFYETKLVELKDASDVATGWPSVTDCDATLWTGMAMAAGALPDLSLAEYKPGEIHRRPAASGECFDGVHGSTVSNDMITGYLAGMWASKNLDALRRLADFGKARNWSMGDGDPTRTILRPNGIGLLGRMIFALSAGADDRGFRQVPPVFLPVAEDYEKHLLVEGITLNGEVNESLKAQGLPGAAGLLDVSSHDFDRLKELSESETSDVLVQAAFAVYSGSYSGVLDGLLATDTGIPSYVRGTTDADSRIYATVHWLRAARLVLDRKGR